MAFVRISNCSSARQKNTPVVTMEEPRFRKRETGSADIEALPCAIM